MVNFVALFSNYTRDHLIVVPSVAALDGDESVLSYFYFIAINNHDIRLINWGETWQTSILISRTL